MANSLGQQFIDESYQKLVQISGSYIANGTGSRIDNLTVTASRSDNATNAVSSSYAITSSHALLASQSLFALDALTATYATGSGVAVSASRAVSSQTADLATFATTAGTALTATSSLAAVSSSYALTATSASYAITASHLLGAITSASYAVSASHAVTASYSDNLLSSNNTWTGNNNFNSLTASNASFTSASIGYLRTITGSATIIGDEFIILNSDSPTKRFAGLKVYDSGSGLTGSFEWDSIDDNWIQVETGGESAGMLTGISGSKGSEAYPTNNVILKGTGNHTVQDSIITDNGSIVTVAGNLSATALIGDGSGLTNIGVVSSSYALSASHAEQADNATSASYAVSSSHAVTASYALNAPNSISASYALSSSHALASNTSISASHALNSDAAITSSFAITASYALNSALQVSASYAVTSSHALVADNLSDGNKVLNGSIKQTFAAPATNTQVQLESVSGANINGTAFNQVGSGWQDFTFADPYKDSRYLEYYDSSAYGYGLEQTINGIRFDLTVDPEGYSPAPQAARGNFSFRSLGVSGSSFQAYASLIEIGAFRGKQVKLGNNSGNVYRNTDFFSITGDDIAITGRVRQNSNAITVVNAGVTFIDFSNKANLFTATMTGDTEFNGSNVPILASAGLGFQMKIDNTGGHTITWNSIFKWAGGTAPTLTTGIHIITFASFGEADIYATAVENLA